jgi:hypothetical protein
MKQFPKYSVTLIPGDAVFTFYGKAGAVLFATLKSKKYINISSIKVTIKMEKIEEPYYIEFGTAQEYNYREIQSYLKTAVKWMAESK